MNNVLFFENKQFITSRDAALNSGYTIDYISRLCRSKKIEGKLIGKTWYVGLESLQDFLEEQGKIKSQKAVQLSEERKLDYRVATIKAKAEVIPQAFESVSRNLHALRDRVVAAVGAVVIVAALYGFGSHGIPILSNVVLPKIAATADEATKQIASIDLGEVAESAYLSSVASADFVTRLTTQDPAAWSALRANITDTASAIGGATADTERALALASIEVREGSLATTAGARASVALGADAVTSTLASFTTSVSTFATSVSRAVYATTNGFFSKVAMLLRPGYQFTDAGDVTKKPPAALETPQPSEGMVVVPGTGDAESDAAKISRIQKSFSDDVAVVPSADGESGVIKPVFRDSKSDDYLYVLVPLKNEKEAP